MLSLRTSMQKTAATIDPSALVAAAQADPAAFATLYDHYVVRVYRYLFSLTENAADAEDLTSQTFLAAFEALPRYRDHGCFSSWLFRIARNKANDHFRKDRPELELEEARTVSTSDVLFEQVAQAQEIQKLSGLLRRLPATDRDLIRLRYVADLSFVEMAELLGKREDAVKKSLYRLLARLQDQMEVTHA